MLRTRAKLFAVLTSLSITSIRCSASFGVVNEPKGPNLLKDPVNPVKVAYKSSQSSIIEQNNVYDNKESKTTYSIEPPIAKQEAVYTRLPWDTTVDNYAWLRDESSPETISYLKAENIYTEYKMKHTETLQKILYKEMLTRIVEDDSSVPAKKDNYLYYTRTESGKSYKIYCRKELINNIESNEEILLNVNELADGKEFMNVGSYDISPNHQILAYSTDESGDEYYNLVFKDLNNGQLLTDKIEKISSSIAWCNDNKTIYYIKYDATWRPYQLWRHTLGDDTSNDELIYQEDDNKFNISIERTRSDKYMILHVGSATTDEVYYINASNPYENNGKFKCVLPREAGVEYSVYNHNNDFLILMNDNAINFQLYSVPTYKIDNVSKLNWNKIIDHNPDITLRSIDCFKDFIVIDQRRNGLPEYRIRYDSADNVNGEHIISLPEATYDIWDTSNYEYNTNKYRFQYTSLITPITTYDYNINNGELETLKIRPVNEYNSDNYQTTRIFATARDGTKVPISLIARKDLDISGSTSYPFHLIGYGSYGVSYDVYFSSSRLSLVDRGVIVGYAHVRGGGEYGRKWKLDGKLNKKMNTFTDFISCSEHLIDNIGLTDNKQLVCSGGSAGGLLMGAIMNMRPDLYHAIIGDVPFVDVLNSILDETIPLTSNEWEEWGDPRTINDYFTIKSYSPYDNISSQKYPNILFEGGLNDARVKYWEPTKFIAKLREYKRNYKHLYNKNENDNTILLKTNMGAGHGGASGRYGRLKEVAFEFAFLLDQLNMLNVKNEFLKVNIDDDDDDKDKNCKTDQAK